MRLLDLFSGIGGFSLGLERAGFRTVAFCEVNPVCRHLLNHHWPEVPCYDDVCTLSGERLAADGVVVDAICGGFPCQDISFAGAGAGIEGARSGLWREYARLVRELRPRLVFVENVAALLGRGLGVVLGDLAALGYDAWWDCIPAAAVGAPHRRDRLWLVAYSRGQQHEGYGDALRRAIAEGLSAATLDHAERFGWRTERDGDGQDVGYQPGTASPHPVDLADAEGEFQHGRRGRTQPAGWHQSPNGSQSLADAARLQPRRPQQWPEWQRAGPGRQPSRARGDDGSYTWLFEPDVGRVAHGVPARVDRLHGLGNAVVPQIPELLGRAALAALAPTTQHQDIAA